MQMAKKKKKDEKLLNIISHKGTTNQNESEMPFHTHYNGYY